MKWPLFLLLALPAVAQTVSIGAQFQAAPNLGYRAGAAGFVEFENDRLAAELTGGPLDKTEVQGGQYWSGTAQYSVWRSFGVATGLQEELAPRWRKTTVEMGPGFRYRGRYVEIRTALYPRFMATPNGGGAVVFTVEYRQRHFLESITTGVEWFNQPFTNPPQRNLLGASVTAGAAYTWGTR